MTINIMTDDGAQVAAAKADSVMEPCTLVLFGASGDLAQRMVMPAIFRLARRGLLSPEFRLIGYARSKMTDDEFRAQIRKAVMREAVMREAGAGDEDCSPVTDGVGVTRPIKQGAKSTSKTPIHLTRKALVCREARRV